MPLRFLTPFAFLALLLLGASIGGLWTFAAAAATPLCLAAFDELFGKDDAPPAPTPAARWLPRLYVVLQMAANAWAAVLVAMPSTSFVEAIGLTLSAGVTTGVFGFVAAHELIHSRNERERALGLLLLASLLYMHFRIAHVHGHHRRAATVEDPASARLGEGLYAFLLRSVAGQFREAWEFERRRRGGNRMIGYLVVEGLLVIAVAVLSVRALAFLIAVAAIAVTLLESFNYVAHYGLVRRIGRNGRPEPLAPHHSWNSGRRMNNAALFNMGRHSDHHRAMARSYEGLETLPAPGLPAGYAAALLTATVPPLWRWIMDPRVQAASTGRL